ncbi:MAG TPA: glutamyl-tRNA reductase [Actinomycetes bacterium]|jgi:glutamyl-tRNA reductase
MSLLVVGVSHRSAPVPLLERVALTGDPLTKLVHDVAATGPVGETVVLSTCNRVEVYADVTKFHAAVAEIPDLIARYTGVPLDELTGHLYVHYEQRAVQHLYSVACGLDSMVVGEAQILGQVREALALAQRLGTAGRVLNELVQQALRVGKRAHTETGIDRAGQSLVSVGLDLVAGALGDTVQGKSAIVVGAGSMSALAAATLRRVGAGRIVIANRTVKRGRRLADQVGGTAVSLAELPAALAQADLLISCTGATGLVVHHDSITAAMALRGGRPIVLLDVALPRDVDPGVREIPGVTLVDLEAIAEASVGAEDVDAVRAIVADEVLAYRGLRVEAQLAPTVAALRSKAAEVVAAELSRLDGRVPELTEQAREEVARTVRRVVEKLLHSPTVRVKELATEPNGHGYAEALRELFDLDPATVAAVTGADTGDPS